MQSLGGAAANLVTYLGKKATVQQIIGELELGHRTVVSFDILMQNFYKLQHGRNDKLQGFINKLEGALDAVQL